MTRGDDQRIADILDACDELEMIITLKQQESTPDQVLLRSAERLLEIIGEAASQVSDERTATYADIDWRSLARLRIVLAHHYHRTDPELIWSYATAQVPALARALRQ
jgi:uncharacterized protein with HEPN domain